MPRPRAASTTPTSMRAAFPTQSAFHQQVLLLHPHNAECLRIMRRRARHRARGFATVEPASGAFLPPRCSRTEELDPTRLHRLITCGREDHAPLVDFCNRWRFASTTCAIDQTLYSQAVLPLSEHNQPRFHRSEAGAANAIADILPPRSLVAEACPQPDRLGHLLSQARFNKGWRSLCRRITPWGYPRARQAGFAFTCPPIGPLHTLSREEEHAPPHPRCLSSTSSPLKGSGSFIPRAVTSVWFENRRLFRLPR